MSLVGKELEVTHSTVSMTETDEEVSNSDDDTNHPPLSPASGAEALFLPGRKTSSISANALARELNRNHRSFMTTSTVATDDYASAYDNLDDLNLKYYEEKQAPAPIYEFEEDPTMSSSAPSTSSNASEVNVNAAEQIYGAAKNVWGWGKQQIVIKTFLGITEAVAGKVVGVVGTDLEEIDGNIKPKLNELDNSIINPAVRAILGIVMNAAGSSEGFLKPIIVSILKPIGLIKGDVKKDTKKDSVAPELTNSRAIDS